MAQEQNIFTRYAEELRNLPSDVRIIWRREGFRGICRDSWSRTGGRLFRWHRLGVYTQDIQYAKKIDPPAGVTISHLTNSDWSALAEIVTSRKLEIYKRAVEKGRHGSVAWRGDRIVGYLLSSDVMEPEFEHFDLQLPPNASYGWQFYVIPAERNNGIGTALVSARLQDAMERGRNVSWRIVRESNLASKSTWRKSAKPGHGAEYQGELRWLKVWRYSRFRFIPKDPQE